MPSDFLEKTVETIIFENKREIERYGLCKFRSKVFRQFILPSGRKLDMFSFDLVDGHIYIDIYELKKECINTDAVAQAYNYLVEIADLIKGNFKSYDIQIIMIGKRYEPIQIFEKMNFPFSVYTYDYQIDGMRFTLRQKVKREYHPNENFSMGLWAFGMNRLYFPHGQHSTVNMEEIFKTHARKDKEFETKLKTLKDTTLNQVVTKHTVEYLRPETVKTVIFPEQPGWSADFLKEIPHTDMLQDFEIDESDYEPEEELDECDYEESQQRPYSRDHEEWVADLNKLIDTINLENDTGDANQDKTDMLKWHRNNK